MTVADRLQTGCRRALARAASLEFIIILASLLLLISGPPPALAKPAKHVSKQVPHAAHVAGRKGAKKAALKKGKAAARKPASKTAAPLRAAILLDAETGTVLRETNPDQLNYPASLTKMMTLYLTFAALNQDKLTLDQRLPVSVHAAGQEPSKLWLKPGDSVRIRNLILALVTRSANDAAVVLAEGIAGGETQFAERMTATARQLGMTQTAFRNASGLPDPAQRTTARDLARLALALHQDFPREFDYFSVREFKFRGRTITGHNRLLANYDGSDGIKTGFTRAAGFNLAASAERDGRRLIGVILGSPSWRVRDRQMAALLDRGFAELGSPQIAAPDTVIAKRGTREPAGTMARLAKLAAPVGKAEAAPVSKPRIRPALVAGGSGGRHNVQIGAFRVRQAARKLARSAARMSMAKGKTVRVIKLPRGARTRLYAVQLSNFTEQDARSVCSTLNKKVPCFVVPKADES